FSSLDMIALVSALSAFLTLSSSFFFFNATAPPEIYTLSLHDALPIWALCARLDDPERGRLAPLAAVIGLGPLVRPDLGVFAVGLDRKSTRLNSSHSQISYAVFCLKKKKKKKTNIRHK